jgi:hypothetical protein
MSSRMAGELALCGSATENMRLTRTASSFHPKSTVIHTNSARIDLAERTRAPCQLATRCSHAKIYTGQTNETSYTRLRRR